MFRPRPASIRRGLRAAVIPVVLLLVGAVAACGRDGGPVPANGPIQLSVFWWGGQQRAEQTEKALRLYSQHHPEVTFRVTWQSSSGYYDRLATQAASGNAPDLFQIDDGYLAEYAQRNITLDLTESVDRKRLDLSGLSPSLVRYGTIGGRVMAVAAAENTPAMVYNRSLLRRLDLPEPAIGMSYPQFLSWSRRVTERSGGRVAGTMDPGADYRALWVWLRAHGEEFYQGQQLGFSAADLARWFELWQDARADRATPSAAVVQPANSGETARQLVVTGRAATSFVWSNQLAELQKYTKDELGLMAYPGDPSAQWARASMYWAGFRGGRHAEIVADVINFLTNDVDAGRILGVERGLNANLGVRRAVSQSLPDAGAKLSVEFEDDMSHRFGAAPPPPPPGHARVRDLLIASAEKTQSGQLTSRAAAAEFVKQANGALTG